MDQRKLSVESGGAGRASTRDRRRARSGRPLIIGFDCEYHSEGDHNRLLSFQAYAIAPDGQTWEIGYLFTKGRRPSLVQLLAAALEEGLRVGVLKRWPKHVVLVSHFTRAEFAHLADFDDKKKRFALVRGSWITTGRPRRIGFWDSSRNHHEIWVSLIDTMLHAPDDQKGLEHLGELIGVSKVSLIEWAQAHAPPGTPEHMMERWANAPVDSTSAAKGVRTRRDRFIFSFLLKLESAKARFGAPQRVPQNQDAVMIRIVPAILLILHPVTLKVAPY